MTIKRNRGLDLLRIILMYMICIIHVLYHGGGLEKVSSKNGLTILNTFCICAVDAYALISGYFASDKPTKYTRILKLWLQAFFYSTTIVFSINIINAITGFGTAVDIKNVIASFLPASYGNWYFKSYFLAFFFFPFINKTISKIDEHLSRKLFILLIVMFSFLTLINDFWSNGGHSPLWIIVLYAIGALINKGNILYKLNKKKLLVIYIVSTLITWMLSRVIGIESFSSNTSPTVLLSAISLILLFSKIEINNTIISSISSLTFGIYLFHDNYYVRLYFIKDKFTFLSDTIVPLNIIYALLIALLVFTISMLVEFVRKKLFDLLKIDKFAEIVVNRIKDILNNIVKQSN